MMLAFPQWSSQSLCKFPNLNFLHKWFIFLHQKCLKFLNLQFNNFQIFEDRSAVGKFMHQLPWSELEVTRDVMFDEDNLTWTELENRKFAAMVNMQPLFQHGLCDVNLIKIRCSLELLLAMH